MEWNLVVTLKKIIFEELIKIKEETNIIAIFLKSYLVRLGILLEKEREREREILLKICYNKYQALIKAIGPLGNNKACVAI